MPAADDRVPWDVGDMVETC